MEVYLNGQRLRLSAGQSVGKGGEADVYCTPSGKALKVFKAPDHADYRGMPADQAAAGERLRVHQEKLPRLLALAPSLPARVVAPDELATDRTGKQVVGYAMRYLPGADVLLRYADRGFRSAGVGPEAVRRTFLDLHDSVAALHRAGVIIGDFNDLNVLVKSAEAYLIDADSFQFGPFPCPVFTLRFLDPLLSDPGSSHLMLCRPYTPASDWYAFAVMLMQCLLFVGPYGGVYRPPNATSQVAHDARPLRRLTVFHPRVQYPKPALPYRRLPDELLHHLHEVFVNDLRGEFPRRLLDDLRWTRCSACSAEHARAVCPECSPTATATAQEVTQVRGKVVARRIFRTEGVIVFATVEGGRPRWLSHDQGRFRREDGSVAFEGPLDPHAHFRLRGDCTFVARPGEVTTFTAGRQTDRLAVDGPDRVPSFDVNDRHRYWTHGGRLLRDGGLGPELIGDVLAEQTRFWVGPAFGFGFYRAGNLGVAFVFDAERRGINDAVPLPPLRGQLVDAACHFWGDRCWFLAATHDGGRTTHQCIVIRSDGSVEATARGEPDDGSWLSGLAGKCAAGPFLFSPTDAGMVRVTVDGGPMKAVEFPATEPFVDAGDRLLAGPEGLYVVGRQQIRLLRMT